MDTERHGCDEVTHLIALTLPAHSSYMQYWDSAKERGKFFLVLGIFMERVFLKVFSLHAARHPADSDGRPGVQPQVPRESMVPWHPYHSGKASTAQQSAVSR